MNELFTSVNSICPQGIAAMFPYTTAMKAQWK